MKFSTTTMIAAAASVLIAGLAATQVSAQDAAAAWKARSDLMRAQIQAYSRIAKAEDAKSTVEDAKIIQASLGKVGDASLWPANSITEQSRAKPEIWQNMGDFNAKLAAARKEADTLVSIAEKGDLEAIKAQAKATNDACNSCHSSYRGPAKR